jgi:hypothetical protein
MSAWFRYGTCMLDLWPDGEDDEPEFGPSALPSRLVPGTRESFDAVGGWAVAYAVEAVFAPPGLAANARHRRCSRTRAPSRSAVDVTLGRA